MTLLLTLAMLWVQAPAPPVWHYIEIRDANEEIHIAQRQGFNSKMVVTCHKDVVSVSLKGNFLIQGKPRIRMVFGSAVRETVSIAEGAAMLDVASTTWLLRELAINLGKYPLEFSIGSPVRYAIGMDNSLWAIRRVVGECYNAA